MTQALTQSPQWQKLRAHQAEMADARMTDLFARDPERTQKYRIPLEGIVLDYSRHVASDETLALLVDLARARGVESLRDAMFAGEAINTTENRAVLHTALRAPEDSVIEADGENVMPYVHACLRKMKDFSERVRTGTWRGFSGERITDVVNIGIGGSDLGPLMVCEALKPFARTDDQEETIRVHFVSNVDGTHLTETLRHLRPEATLFLIASKTFTTQETMTNADSARAWFTARTGAPEGIAQHFVAISTNTKAVAAFGIDPENMFPFREWVGGRYSLWSSIGLSICLSVGFAHFRALLNGAHAMDCHFRSAPLESNMPVMMALLGVWYRNFRGAPAHAVLPYDQYLHRFPAFLQQMDMESNGKSVDRDGQPVTYETGSVIFGEPGTNGQHAFYQLLHQGTDIIPCDFIAPCQSANPVGVHHKLLLANVLAQPQALMRGRDLAHSGGDSQKTFAGNRPSNTLLVDRLDPYSLGMLIALYEHKVFVQGVIWNLNSFDQWGVELGKILAGDVLKAWDDPQSAEDPTTRALLAHVRKNETET